MLSSLSKSIIGGHRGNYTNVIKRLMNQWVQQPSGAKPGTSTLQWSTDVPRSRPAERAVETNDLLDVLFARCTPVARFHPDLTNSLASRTIQPWPVTNETAVGSLSCFNSSPSSLEERRCMNRNGRRPNRANHGARPCSRSSRRWKKEQIGKRRRG